VSRFRDKPRVPITAAVRYQFSVTLPMFVSANRFTSGSAFLFLCVATFGTPRPAAPRQPANPQRPTAQPAAKPAEPPAPPKPVAQDLRMKTVHSTGPQRTESLTFIKGNRERYEFANTVLLRQHDLQKVGRPDLKKGQVR